MMNTDNLTATKNTDGWCVTDTAGGTWWPSDDAATEILGEVDSAAAAIRMCDQEPMRGTWKS